MILYATKKKHLCCGLSLRICLVGIGSVLVPKKCDAKSLAPRHVLRTCGKHGLDDMGRSPRNEAVYIVGAVSLVNGKQYTEKNIYSKLLQYTYEIIRNTNCNTPGRV